MRTRDFILFCPDNARTHRQRRDEKATARVLRHDSATGSQYGHSYCRISYKNTPSLGVAPLARNAATSVNCRETPLFTSRGVVKETVLFYDALSMNAKKQQPGAVGFIILAILPYKYFCAMVMNSLNLTNHNSAICCCFLQSVKSACFGTSNVWNNE